MNSVQTSAETDSMEQKVLFEQVSMLFKSMVPVFAINLIVGSALIFPLWDIVSHGILITWISLIVLMLIVRSVFYVYLKRDFRKEFVKRYGLFLTIGSACAGLIWGFGGLLMLPPDNLEYQLFILFILSAMGVGSTSSLYIYLPAFYAFFPILLLPVGIHFIFNGDNIQLTLGILTIFYVLIISVFNININRNLKLSLQLRFENLELVEQLREQKDEADKANNAKSKFLSAASHDVRQPLYALSLFTSVLKERDQAPETSKVIEQIETSVESMKSLFNALLNISLLDAGAMKPEKSDFLLLPFFENLANDFDPIAAEKNLSILWPTSNMAIHSDRKLIEQIMRNYIANAIRYTDEGHITISCDSNGEDTDISVTDTGIGIDLKDQKHIFEEFNQIGNPERDRTKGLGLGLAIVKRAARLLNHPIQIESQSGQGSTFSISVKSASTENCSAKNTSAKRFENTDAHHYVIVVIDDEAAVREGTQALLQSWGCTAFAASDQDEALSLLRQQNQKPDGIIADYRLKDNRTGIEAILAIQKKYEEKIPALIVTGDIAVEQLQDVSRSGFQMLHKPVKALKLRTFLRNLKNH